MGRRPGLGTVVKNKLYSHIGIKLGSSAHSLIAILLSYSNSQKEQFTCKSLCLEQNEAHIRVLI
jgi:hypothetical protein